MATGTVTSTQTPQYNPYQQYGVQQAYNYYQGGGTPVVGFSPQQEQAMAGISQRATNGSPVTNAAQSYVQSVLNPSFTQGPTFNTNFGSPYAMPNMTFSSGSPMAQMGGPAAAPAPPGPLSAPGAPSTAAPGTAPASTGNPYLGQLFNQGADQIQNRLESEFAGAGRNVGQSQGVQGQALANFGSQLYGNAYNTEAQQQANALGQSIPLANQDYTDLYQLEGVGNNVQQLGQEYAQQPLTNLNQYLAQTMGNVGQASTTPYFTNTGASTLGGALLGGQFGSYLSGGSNLGSILGTLGGGLLGAFG